MEESVERNQEYKCRRCKNIKTIISTLMIPDMVTYGYKTDFKPKEYYCKECQKTTVHDIISDDVILHQNKQIGSKYE